MLALNCGPLLETSYLQGVDLPHAGYMTTKENPPQSKALIIECGVDGCYCSTMGCTTETVELYLQLDKSDKNSGRWCNGSSSET